MTFNTVCILGMGYIGLPTACMFTQSGVRVLGVDIHAEIVDTLNRGQIHIHEPGLAEAVNKAVAAGMLHAATAPQPSDAFIIAVPTPFYLDDLGEYDGQSYKKADMRAVASAARSIVPHLRQGNLVVLESTSPPRTTIDLVKPILEESGLVAGRDFTLAYSPERVLPGQILRELVENARVIGGIDPASAQAGADLYGAFVKGQIYQTDSTTAEMVKLMENTYRDVNIAIANEFSRLSSRFGVDVWEAIQLASLHPRVKILSPGPGVGGHCISVDPWFFVESAPDLANLIAKARAVNDGQPHYLLQQLRELLGGSLQGRNIAALGLAYKPDVDDLRESPAVEVVHLLAQAGAHVLAWEPFKPQANLPGVQQAASLAQAIGQADVLLLLVAHSEFKALQPADVAKATPARVLYDAVGVLDAPAWRKAGFTVHRLGDAGRNSK